MQNPSYHKLAPTGERDLLTLLIDMKPALDHREWVFCEVSPAYDAAPLEPLMVFRENESNTIVIERSTAERAGLTYQFPCRRITLRVHSDLHSVGFLSALLRELALHGIPTNAASAFYHDHIFVPANVAVDALHVLDELSASTARRALGERSGH